MKYTYTIIIPHKNSPKLLQRCLDSIPQREDLHVIVVDDNSDSDEVDFNHFPGHNRDDVELIFTKEGKGAGYARNVGLAQSDCKKVIFADADDYFNYCLNDILDEYQEDDTDIVFFNRLNVDSEFYTYSNKRDWYGWLFRKYEENPQEGEKSFRYDNDGPVCKIVKKSLIDEYNICFEETTNQNDVCFSYMTGYYAKSIKVDKRAIYTVTFSPKSIMFSWNPNKIKTRLGVYCRRARFLQEHNVIEQYYRLDWLLADVKKQDEELFKECLGILNEHGLETQFYINGMNEKLKREEKMRKRNRIKSFTIKATSPLKKVINKILPL